MCNSNMPMVPMLICDDTQDSIRFYSDVLGFEVTDRMDNVGKSGWAALSLGNTRLMLASPDYLPTAQKTKDGRFSQAIYYFYPEDVEQLHSDIREKGYKVSDLALRFYGMNEFEMVDPSGHMLIFGQATDD